MDPTINTTEDFVFQSPIYDEGILFFGKRLGLFRNCFDLGVPIYTITFQDT